MRAFFVAMPAILVGLLFLPVSPVVAGIVALGMVGLGLSCTKARPERGEGHGG